MTAPYAIEVLGVTKSFRRRTVKGGVTTLKTQLVNLFSKSARERFELRTADVLKGIDLQIPAGQTVGIIGRNGSGKSTLLKILTGIYTPTSGTVNVRGRLSALLELGAGFHPEFSGRENILINGVILGLTRKEIRKRLDEIIEFSELREFIDEPVRTYSTGMYMRLAFAVATLVDPDVLIIDEILSVGDEHFSRKSRAKMEEFKHRGKTIVLVTHDLKSVEEWCDLAAWLDNGRITEVGNPRRVVAAYRQHVAVDEVRAIATEDQSSASAEVASPVPVESRPEPKRWGDQSVVINQTRLLDSRGRSQTVYEPESALRIEIDYERRSGVGSAVFGVGLFRDDGTQLFGTNTRIDRFVVPAPLPAKGTVTLQFDRLCLNEGNYLVDVAVVSETDVAHDYQKGATTFAVRSEIRDVGYVRPPHRWEIQGEAHAQKLGTGT